MKKLLPNANFRGGCQTQSRLVDLGIVFAILLFIFGCNFSSSGFKNNRNRRNGNMRSTPTPERAAANQSATTADSQLTTTLVTQTARFYQASDLHDKTAMAQVMADDFSYYSDNSDQPFTKEEFIEGIKEEPDFVSVTIKNPRITASDNATATMEYLRIEEYTKRTDSANCRSSYGKSGSIWLIKDFICSELTTVNK